MLNHSSSPILIASRHNRNYLRQVLIPSWTIATLLEMPPLLETTSKMVLSLEQPAQLVKEFYSKTSVYNNNNQVTLTKSPSKASFHLKQPHQLANVLGLAMCKANDVKIEQDLLRVGIKTNHVHNQWTGVSLHRFKRIISLLTTATEDDIVLLPSYQIFVKAVQDKCSTQEQFDEFFNILQNNYLSKCHDETTSAATTTTPADDDRNTNELVLLAQAVHLALKQSSSKKPRIRVERHVCHFDGPNKPSRVVPDCVEVVIREIIEFLIFNYEHGQFDLNKLPPTTNRNVYEFFSNQVVVNAGATKDHQQQQQRVLTTSRKWFDLCQNLSASEIEYLCIGQQNNVRYELMPDSKTVARVLGILLFSTSSDVSSMEDFVRKWNTTMLPPNQLWDTLTTSKHIQKIRPVLQEETIHREIIELSKRINHKTTLHQVSDSVVVAETLEITLERQHRLASVRYFNPPLAHQSDNNQHLLSLLQKFNSTVADNHTLFQPPYLALNFTLQSDHVWKIVNKNCTLQNIIVGILSTRWNGERHPIFDPYHGKAQLSITEQALEERKALDHVLLALQSIRQQLTKARNDPNQDLNLVKNDLQFIFKWILRLSKETIVKSSSSFKLLRLLSQTHGDVVGWDSSNNSTHWIKFVCQETGIDLSKTSSVFGRWMVKLL
jgi:hypothetical protein